MNERDPGENCRGTIIPGKSDTGAATAEASGTAIMTTAGGISTACLSGSRRETPEHQRLRRFLSIAHKVCSPNGRSS